MTIQATPKQVCQLCAAEGSMTTTRSERVVCLDPIACLDRWKEQRMKKKEEKPKKPSVCKDKVCLHGSVKHVGGPCIVFGCPCQELK